ncbi:MAG: exodeoxyribonuclease VII small subunit [Deltaproteobacteria bacterium]|nr:MAG: exodeoxyribonuclease VII small subunit [Deltaproteobacteria bacterium]
MGKKRDSFEEKLAALQEIVTQLETGEPALEHGVELFKQGVTLARECRTELDQAKKEVQVLADGMWKDMDHNEDNDDSHLTQ